MTEDKIQDLEKPIFIGGLTGSGTTMLVQTLNQHKNIAGYDETQLIRILDIMRKQLLADDSELHTRYLSRYVTDDAVVESIRLFAKHIWLQKPWADGKKRCAEKSPPNYMHWNMLKTLFPDAKLIFLIRDGRDMACSGFYYKYYQDTASAAERWKKDIGISRREAAPFTDDYLEIKYEDIINNTRETMKHLLEFIEEEEDEAVYHLFKSSKFTRRWGKDGKPTAPVGRWRDDPRFDKDVFKEVAGDLLIQLEYEDDPNW